MKHQKSISLNNTINVPIAKTLTKAYQTKKLVGSFFPPALILLNNI